MDQSHVLKVSSSNLLVSICKMARISLDEEVRLWNTNAEREKYESLATLYGIIVALDYLERAYVRDSVTAAQYVSRSA